MNPSQPSSDNLLTVQQLAHRLRISVALAYRLVANGQFTVVRVGVRRGTIRIPTSKIDRYLNEGEK